MAGDDRYCTESWYGEFVSVDQSARDRMLVTALREDGTDKHAIWRQVGEKLTESMKAYADVNCDMFEPSLMHLVIMRMLQLLERLSLLDVTAVDFALHSVR